MKQDKDSQGLASDIVNGCSVAAPPAPWSAIGIEEKLDRLRQECLLARSFARWAPHRFQGIEQRMLELESHQHAPTGAVLVDLAAARRAGRSDAGQAVGILGGGFDPLE